MDPDSSWILRREAPLTLDKNDLVNKRGHFAQHTICHSLVQSLSPSPVLDQELKVILDAWICPGSLTPHLHGVSQVLLSNKCKAVPTVIRGD